MSLMDGKAEQLISENVYIVDMERRQFKENNGEFKGVCAYHPKDDFQVICKDEDWVGYYQTLHMNTLGEPVFTSTMTASALPALMASTGTCTTGASEGVQE